MPAAEVEQRVARQRRGASARSASSRASRVHAGAARAPRLDRRDPLGGARVAEVDEVVERAEDEVEPVDVVAHLARQQPAGERERPRDAARRRRAPRERRVRRRQRGLRPRPAARRPRDQPGGDLGAEQHAGHAGARVGAAADVVQPAQRPVAVGRRNAADWCSVGSIANALPPRGAELALEVHRRHAVLDRDRRRRGPSRPNVVS